MRLGEIIRKWRMTCEMGQRQVAKEIGINVSTLCRVENGEGMDGVTLAAILRWMTEARP
jgi:DNA-binding XRE family transcriptional regulator